MPHELLLDEAKADELSQHLHSTMAGKTAQTGKTIEREGFGSLGKKTQQGLLTLGKRKHSTAVPTLFAPEGHLHGRGYDILIGNAYEGAEAIIVEAGTHRNLLGALDLGNHHIVSLDTMDAHAALHRRHTVHRSSGLDHIDLFVATHTGYLAIVLDTDEQSAPVSIGKSREGACNLARIGDLILEILLLMFALSDEMVEHGSFRKLRIDSYTTDDLKITQRKIWIEEKGLYSV